MDFLITSFSNEANLETMPKTEKKTGFFSSVRNAFSGRKEEPVEPKDCKGRIAKAFEIERSYTSFFVCLGSGLAFLIMSLFALPTILIFPKKFTFLFSLASFLTIFSFIFIYGTKEFLSMLFDSRRAIFTYLYFASIFIGTFFTFTDYFIVSHICAIFQLITTVCFVLSFIPGGGYANSFIWGSIKSIFVKNIESQ